MYNGQNYWGGGTIIGTTQTITNLSYNTYLSVNVTDANGCIPSGGNAVYDSFPIMLDPACYDHISGYVYYDSNGNCIMDANEHGLTGAYITAVSASGSTYYGNVDSTGFYDVEVMPGIYTVSVSLYTYGSCTISTCVTSYTDTFTTTGQISSGNNFGTNSGSPTFDLGVHMGYLGSQPGQQREYWVYYYNWGQTSVANGVLTFVHDPNITLVSTTPAYTSYNAATQTITWDIVNNLAPMFWLDAQHQVIMYFDIPSTVTLGTMLMDEALYFMRMGTFLERADNTARLVDVKFHAVQSDFYGTASEKDQEYDFYHWSAILRSVSGFEVYRKVYRDVIKPERVAELLILRPDMPRSLHASMNEVVNNLALVANEQSAETHRRAGKLCAELKYGRIDEIMATGLHAYLTQFLDRVNDLGMHISRDFLVPSAA